jgi:hypothetical protein
MVGWGASGALPKGSMQLAAGICGVGVVFSFFQVCGSSAAPVADIRVQTSLQSEFSPGCSGVGLGLGFRV